MRNFRYLLLLLSTTSMTFIYSNRIVFGFTVICQQTPNSTDDYYLNDSLNMAWMFTSTAIGMCIGPLPFYILKEMSTRWLIMAYAVVSALSSALFPLADSVGLWPALACRFLSGFAQASQLHFSNDVILKWTPNAEASLFFSVILSASQFGPLITMTLGGEMCSSPRFGWESTYYILAALTFASSSLFAFVYTDDVEKNPFVEDKEKIYILEGKEPKKQNGHVAYKQLMSDVTILISLLMFCGYYVGMIVYQQYSPTFIKQVLSYTIRETGYFSAIPMVAAIAIKVGLGKIIDHGFGMGDKWRLALPLLLLEAPSALAIFLTGFVDDRRLALMFNMIFASLHFFVPVICSRTIQIRAAQMAHFALNLNMVIAGIAQIFIPMGIHVSVPNNTRAQWSNVFYFIATLILITTMAYVLLTKASPAPWTKPTEGNKEPEES